MKGVSQDCSTQKVQTDLTGLDFSFVVIILII
jgi:hypothetical protein